MRNLHLIKNHKSLDEPLRFNFIIEISDVRHALWALRVFNGNKKMEDQIKLLCCDIADAAVKYEDDIEYVVKLSKAIKTSRLYIKGEAPFREMQAARQSTYDLHDSSVGRDYCFFGLMHISGAVLMATDAAKSEDIFFLS